MNGNADKIISKWQHLFHSELRGNYRKGTSSKELNLRTVDLDENFLMKSLTLHIFGFGFQTDNLSRLTGA